MSSVCVVTIYATSFVQVCAFVGSSLTNSRHVSHISHRPSHSMVSIFGKLSIVSLCLFVLCLNGATSMVLPLRFRPTESSYDQLDSSRPSTESPDMLVPLEQPRQAKGETWMISCLDATSPMDRTMADDIPLASMYQKLVTLTRKAKLNGELIKHEFLQQIAKDHLFELGLKDRRESWLPEVPNPSTEMFENYSTPEKSLKETFRLMQYFAIGLNQVLMDMEPRGGKLLHRFKEIKDDLYSVLCEIQLGMYVKSIEVDEHVLQDVMSHRYRDIESDTKRNVRDFLILRDYIKLLDFVGQLFAHLRLNA